MWRLYATMVGFRIERMLSSEQLLFEIPYSIPFLMAEPAFSQFPTPTGSSGLR